MADRPKFLDDRDAFLRRLILSMALSPPPSRAWWERVRRARPPDQAQKKR
jgi:hypothetical protein